jgi:hypothetical protein
MVLSQSYSGMPSPFFAEIDWSRPWYAAVRASAQTIIAAPDWRMALNAQAAARGLRNQRGLPLAFVPQADLPAGTAYEAFISATGCVPTRDNLHDFFNALVWLTFPRIKVQLNALQAAQIARDGIGKARGAARDAATIFDENTALLVLRDDAAGRALLDALRSHQWHSAFITQRASFGRDAEVWLFGHALMDKLMTPYKGITAHVYPLLAETAFFTLTAGAKRDWIDGHVVQQLAASGFDTCCFTPLPMLGVPGWWQGQNQAFYADTAVFRPPRQPRTARGNS